MWEMLKWPLFLTFGPTKYQGRLEIVFFSITPAFSPHSPSQIHRFFQHPCLIWNGCVCDMLRDVISKREGGTFYMRFYSQPPRGHHCTSDLECLVFLATNLFLWPESPSIFWPVPPSGGVFGHLTDFKTNWLIDRAQEPYGMVGIVVL